jgi:hypothetical protein
VAQPDARLTFAAEQQRVRSVLEARSDQVIALCDPRYYDT